MHGPHSRAIAEVIGAFALVVIGWFVAGWGARMVGLDELDLPIRAVGIFALLSLGEAGYTKFMTKHN